MNVATKIAGEPSYVMARVCQSCHARHLKLKYSQQIGGMRYWCMRCDGFTKTTFAAVDDWQVCHAKESRNHKFGRAPNIETEDGRPFEELRAHQPIVQDWYDWAHLELYKYTEREKQLKARVIHNIYINLRDSTIDAAGKSLASIAAIKIESPVESIIADCAEMMRPNSTFIAGSGGVSSRDRGINRGFIASKHGFVRENIYMRDKPLSRLIAEIVEIITSFELCI